jgi:thiol-disulfide isomerase/thioredoxin
MKRVVLAIAVVFCLFPLSLSALSQGDSSISQQEHPVSYETLDGGVISVEELAQGRWALLFVIFPGCPACEQAVDWFGLAAEAFPEIQFLLVTPKLTLEFNTSAKEHSPGISVFLDQGGRVGASLELTQAPSLVLSAEGVGIARLDWPFTEGELFRKLAESLLIEVEPRTELPNPKELLGQVAPNFSALDLSGSEVSLAELPRPLFLVFLSPGCPSCWGCLPILTQLAEEMAVALVVPVRQARLPVTDRQRLERFQRSLKEKPVYLLLAQGSKALEAYKLAVSPTYFLINGKGVILGVWEGQAQVEELLGAVRNLE